MIKFGKIKSVVLHFAVNAFNGESNKVKNQLDGAYVEVSTAAKAYKAKGISSVCRQRVIALLDFPCAVCFALCGGSETYVSFLTFSRASAW